MFLLLSKHAGQVIFVIAELTRIEIFSFSHMASTPKEAKRILASASPFSPTELEKAIRRVSYDPEVLKEDGWTTVKSDEPNRNQDCK